MNGYPIFVGAGHLVPNRDTVPQNKTTLKIDPNPNHRCKKINMNSTWNSTKFLDSTFVLRLQFFVSHLFKQLGQGRHDVGISHCAALKKSRHACATLDQCLRLVEVARIIQETCPGALRIPKAPKKSWKTWCTVQVVIQKWPFFFDVLTLEVTKNLWFRVRNHHHPKKGHFQNASCTFVLSGNCVG